MHWKRGFFRLWLVLSVVWAVFVVAAEGADELFGLAIVPAAVLFAVGIGVSWALQGFRGL